MRERQRAALARLFAAQCDVVPIVSVGKAPEALLALVRDHEVQIVVAGGGPAHLQILTTVADRKIVLYPVERDQWTPHGIERVFDSYGRLRADGSVEPLPDGALQSTP